MSAAAAGEKVGCVGVVGSSGAVGMEMIKVLNKRNFPTERIRLFARRAAGTTVETGSVFGAVTASLPSLQPLPLSLLFPFILLQGG